MRKLVILAFFIPTIAWAHPLPSGYCDTSTVIASCVDACKEGLTGPPVFQRLKFKQCLDNCLFSMTCEDINRVKSHVGTLLFLKSASDTPQIEGVWVGTASIVSDRGVVTEPAEFTISTNEFGNASGFLKFRPEETGEPWSSPVNDTYFSNFQGVLTQTSQNVWSVLFSYRFGLMIGTFNIVGAPEDDVFTLELSCPDAQTVFPSEVTFSCPFSAKVEFARE